MLKTKLSLIPTVLAIGLLSGCGGLTQGSTAVVTIQSENLKEVELIVVPNERSTSDPLACSESQQPKWCTWQEKPNQISQSFKIDPQFAPFAVYVRNKDTNTLVKAKVKIYVDGLEAFNSEDDYFAGETRRIARVFPG